MDRKQAARLVSAKTGQSIIGAYKGLVPRDSVAPGSGGLRAPSSRLYPREEPFEGIRSVPLSADIGYSVFE